MNSKMSSAFSFIHFLLFSRIACSLINVTVSLCFLIPDIILTLSAGFNDVSALTLVKRRYTELGKGWSASYYPSMPFKFSIFVK